MTVLDVLLAAAPHVAPSAVSLDQWHAVPSAGGLTLTSRPPVQDSEEVRRVAALPRRPQVDLGPLSPTAQALVQIMNDRLRRPDWQRTDCKCAALAPERTQGGRRACILSLLPAQAWALYEAPLVGGLVGLIMTGGGKTATGILMGTAFNEVPGQTRPCKLVVGLVPSNLVEQLVREFLLWREHWKVPRLVYGQNKTELKDVYLNPGFRPTLHVVPYSRLSLPTSTTLLKDLNPDLVWADEMDKLANLDSARTARFTRAFAEVPDTRFCGWTGTPWDRSIMECTHLADYALKTRSPLPRDPHVARGWALALDPSERRAAAGALRKFCAPSETLHEGFHRRLVETQGVVATKEGAVAVPLVLLERQVPDIPQRVLDMLDQVRGFERPDGEELVDDMEVARVASEVACGFYYKWVFPKEERDPEGKLTAAAIQRIDLWFERRKAWRRELRLKLKAREEYLDSEKLCTEAAARFYAGRLGEVDSDVPELRQLAEAAPYEGDLPTWESESYLLWLEVADSVYHETEVVRVDDFLVRDAAEWARERRGIVWYKHVAFGEWVAEVASLPMHGGGAGAEQRILAERGDRSIVVSIDSHGRGRDGLQYLFNEQYVSTFPGSGKMAEQLLARLHRVGQRESEVRTWIPLHIDELRAAFDKACGRARFANETWGAAQKLLDADCAWRDDDE